MPKKKVKPDDDNEEVSGEGFEEDQYVRKSGIPDEELPEEDPLYGDEGTESFLEFAVRSEYIGGVPSEVIETMSSGRTGNILSLTQNYSQNLEQIFFNEGLTGALNQLKNIVESISAYYEFYLTLKRASDQSAERSDREFAETLEKLIPMDVFDEFNKHAKRWIKFREDRLQDYTNARIEQLLFRTGRAAEDLEYSVEAVFQIEGKVERKIITEGINGYVSEKDMGELIRENFSPEAIIAGRNLIRILGQKRFILLAERIKHSDRNLEKILDWIFGLREDMPYDALSFQEVATADFLVRYSLPDLEDLSYSGSDYGFKVKSKGNIITYGAMKALAEKDKKIAIQHIKDSESVIEPIAAHVAGIARDHGPDAVPKDLKNMVLRYWNCNFHHGYQKGDAIEPAQFEGQLFTKSMYHHYWKTVSPIGHRITRTKKRKQDYQIIRMVGAETLLRERLGPSFGVGV